MNIEKIKGMFCAHEKFYAGDSGDSGEAISYLLSIIEQAEKAFEQILVVDLDYSFEDVDQMKIIAEEALQAIRKGD